MEKTKDNLKAIILENIQLNRESGMDTEVYEQLLKLLDNEE